MNDGWGVDAAFIGEDGWPVYPPNNGRVPGTEQFGMLDQSVPLDRYGAEGKPLGGYLGEPGATIAERGLPPTRPDGYQVFTYTPKTDVPDLPIIQSEVLPWFDQPGGGQQIEFDVPRAMELYAGDPDFNDMFDVDRGRLKPDYWFDIE